MIATRLCGLRRVVLACLALLLVGAIAPREAAASPALEEALALLLNDTYSDTDAAIGKIAAYGQPRARAILEALADRRLLFDPASKSVAIKLGDKFEAALDGKALPGWPADAGPVRVNNRLRGLIEAALGSLALTAGDPAQRLAAAAALVKSRDIKALAQIEAALAQEKDQRVLRALFAARAAVTLSQPGAAASDKREAIALLSGRVDPDTLGLLRGVAARDASPDVRAAAETALARIEQQIKLISAVQNVWYGLSLGSVLLLAAAGLAITFGVMGVINMAHGEMVMIGAYTTYVVQMAFKAYAPAAVDYALLAALPLAFLVAGAVGIAIERGIIRFLYGRPLETLLATWGVSLILQQAIRVQFGASNVPVSAPSYMSGSFEIFGLVITYGRLWIIVFALLAFTALQFAIRATSAGLKMRAVTQNRRMASSMGIATGRVDALTFGLGSGIAGVAGVALSQIDNVAPNLGQSYIVDCFMVVVFGGVGNLWGTLVSAFTLGIANKLLEPLAGAVLGKIAILVLIILFIQKHPRGLFAQKGRAVEA